MKKILFFFANIIFTAVLLSCTLVCRHKHCTWVTVVPPTYTAEGINALRCDRCGAEIGTAVVEKKICPHGDCEWVTTSEPTYISEGLKEYVCRGCEKVISSKTIEKKFCSHPEICWIVDLEPTATERGSRHSECTVCKETLEVTALPSIGKTQAEIEQVLGESVIKVFSLDYDGKTIRTKGSGVFLDDQGTFVTNAHVIEDCYYLEIETEAGVRYEVDTLYTYEYDVSDIAVCRAKGISSVPAVFSEDVVAGDPVYSFGYPNDAVLLRVTSGEILSASCTDGVNFYYSTTAEIDHGSSGGALVNNQGQVIGITTALLKNGKFASLRYVDLKPYITAEHTNGTPVEGYFHPVRTVFLNSGNVSTYFSYGLSNAELDGATVYYDLSAGLKPEYAKVRMDGTGLSLVFNVNTVFTCSRRTDSGTTEQEIREKTGGPSLYFPDTASLYTGISGRYSESVELTPGISYYVSVNLKIDGILSGSGILKIYE